MDKKLEQYINKQPERQKVILLKIRETIKKLIPRAEEKMSYGAPSFKMSGKTLMYAAFKSHIGLYPEPEIIEQFKNELTSYETSKGTIKFKLGEPIPYPLIERIVRTKFG